MKQQIIVFLLIFCIFFTISLAVHQEISCSNVMRNGFDKVKGSSRSPVFKMSLSSNKTWTSPSGKTFAIPDGLNLTPLRDTDEKVVATLTKIYEEYLREFVSSYGFSIGLRTKEFSLAFQYSEVLHQVYHELMDNLRYVGFSYHDTAIFELFGLPIDLLEVDPNFLEEFRSLPASIQSPVDLKRWKRFVQYYGTHYVMRVACGGRFEMSTFLDREVAEKYSAEWVSTMMKLIFHLEVFDISTGGFDNQEEIMKKISEEFIMASTTNISWHGGDVGLHSNDTLKEWQRSIDGDNSQPVEFEEGGLLSDPLELTEDPAKVETYRSVLKEYIENDTIERNFIQKTSQDQLSEEFPGFYMVGHGLNEFTGKPTFLLTETSYELEKTWTNPFNHKMYKIPDGISISVTPEFFMVNGSIIFDSMDEYRIFEKKHSGSDYLICSRSKEEIFLMHHLYEMDQALSISEIGYRYFTVSHIPLPLPILSATAAHELDMLRFKKYDASTKSLFWRFFKEVGTAWIIEVDVGALMTMRTWFHHCLVETFSMTWVIEQSGWNFLGMIGNGRGTSFHNSHLSESFVLSEQSEFSFRGGDSGYQPNEWRLWGDSIQDENMESIGYHVAPIYLLVQNDEFLKQNVRLALEDYIQEQNNVTKKIENVFIANDPGYTPEWCHQ